MLRYSYKTILITRYFIKLKLPDFLKKTSLTLSLKLMSLIKYIFLIFNLLIRLSIKTLKINLRS
jgi:hypothetical protein